MGRQGDALVDRFKERSQAGLIQYVEVVDKGCGDGGVGPRFGHREIRNQAQHQRRVIRRLEFLQFSQRLLDSGKWLVVVLGVDQRVAEVEQQSPDHGGCLVWLARTVSPVRAEPPCHASRGGVAVDVPVRIWDPAYQLRGRRDTTI